MAQEDPPDPFIELASWAATTERRVRGSRRRERLFKLIPLLVTGVLAVVVLVVAVRPMLSSSGPGVVIPAVPVATRADPFAGTPAENYPSGAAGITLPAPAAVDGFSAAQVGAALEQVRRAMIAGRLDDRMLTGHDPSRLIALLAPNQRGPVGAAFRSAKFAGYATWIDPAVPLDARQDPRVAGRLTIASTTVDGIRTLRVTSNFIWVYAFDRADHPVAATHDEVRWDFPASTNLRAGDQGMWIGDTKSYTALVDCAASDRGLLAPTRPDDGRAGPSSEDPEKLLSADHALDIGDNCA